MHKLCLVTDKIMEDIGYYCGGIAVQGMRLKSMNCAERGNGFVCEIPGNKIISQNYET